MSSTPQTSSPVAIAMSDCLPQTLAHTDVPAPAAAPRVARPFMGTASATLLVIASMIGTGVFTTTGFLLNDIPSSPAVLLAWAIGGVVALFGALSYAELVSAMPRNGGEYQLLGRIFHPAVGFVAGWVSLIVGFSAPIAASAIAFGVYFSAVFPGVSPMLAAIALLVFLSLVHGTRVSLGRGLQNVFTIANVVVVVAFIIGGLIFGSPSHLLSDPPTEVLSSIASPGFAVGLIFVSFAYSGWNGAAYLAGEMRNPARSLPRALAIGTALVTLLYLGLNIVFLSSAPTEELAGAIDVGTVAAVNLFGTSAGRALSAVIALLLFSSVSAAMMAGPRVYQAIGEDYEFFRFLRVRSKQAGPVAAIALQAGVALLMLLTSSFDALLTYIGFTLSVSAGLTVFGVFYMRRRHPKLARPYRCWGYPFTPIVFIALSCWMIVFTLTEVPYVAFAGIATIASGLGLFYLARRKPMRDLTQPGA